MNKLIFTVVLIVLANTNPATAASFTRDTLPVAVKLWFDDEKEARNQYGNIVDWDTKEVTLMKFLFKDRPNFNEDITKWDTSKVTDMGKMFYGCTEFNQPIGSWDVSKVGMANDMFKGASSFNQDLSKWNTAKFSVISGMFFKATKFNGDITTWDTSSVYEMSQVFYHATAFNRDISKWNTATSTTMTGMFEGASSFNQNLSNWSLESAGEITRGMFKLACSLECKNFVEKLQNRCPEVTELCNKDPCPQHKKEAECNSELPCIWFKGVCQLGKLFNEAPTECSRKGGKACGYQPRITGKRFTVYAKPGKLGSKRFALHNACALQKRKFEKAESICKEAGASLCSEKDLRQGAHRKHLRSCNMSMRKYVWTSTACIDSRNREGRRVMHKNGKGKAGCLKLKGRQHRHFYVTCCVLQ